MNDIKYALQSTGMWAGIVEDVRKETDKGGEESPEKKATTDIEGGEQPETEEYWKAQNDNSYSSRMEGRVEGEQENNPAERSESSNTRPRRNRQRPMSLQDVEMFSEVGTEGSVWTLRHPKRRKSSNLRIPAVVRENRIRGWIKMEIGANGIWQLEGLEIRPSAAHGGEGGRGVFVREGYYLETQTIIPYFGRWITKEEIDWEHPEYVVGPLLEGGYVDGNPTVVANNKHGPDAAIWAGALINQANTPEQRNCLLGDVAASARVPARNHYMGQCAEGLYVKVETTRTVRAGEELLTNYGLDFTGQWATRCGYDYYAVTVLGEARGEGERQDPEACPDSQNRSRRRG